MAHEVKQEVRIPILSDRDGIMVHKPGQFGKLNHVLSRMMSTIGSGTPGSIATHAIACLNVKELEKLTAEIEYFVGKHNEHLTHKKKVRRKLDGKN